MKLDYGTKLSPYPISLSVGTLIKPKLRDICNISFEAFEYYKVLLKMTPDFFYEHIKKDGGKEYWNSLSDTEKEKITLYKIIVDDENLIKSYLEVFNFFFVEDVVFRYGYFVWIKQGVDSNKLELSMDDVLGVIDEINFENIIYVLQQVCCIENKEKEDIEKMRFKNNLAKKLYMRMQEKQSKKEKDNIDYSLPNIISAVSNKHPTISPTNVWDLTVFQLLDSFNRLITNSFYEIERTRVSVWGDEKKTFDPSLWYKNEKR